MPSKSLDRDPIKTDTRRRRREDRFPDSNPRCVLCGHPNLEAIKSVTVGWLKSRGIELHHVVGRAREPDLVVPLCLNCHRRATEGLTQAGVEMIAETDTRLRVASTLDGLAAFFEMVVDALRKWAADLRKDSKE